MTSGEFLPSTIHAGKAIPALNSCLPSGWPYNLSLSSVSVQRFLFCHAQRQILFRKLTLFDKLPSTDEWRVLAFNDPCWQGDTGAELLLAVGVAVQLVMEEADSHFVELTKAYKA
jgi:hypothetical protein